MLTDQEYRRSTYRKAAVAAAAAGSGSQIGDLRFANGFCNGDARRKRHTADSGYGSEQPLDRRWSQEFAQEVREIDAFVLLTCSLFVSRFEYNQLHYMYLAFIHQRFAPTSSPYKLVDVMTFLLFSKSFLGFGMRRRSSCFCRALYFLRLCYVQPLVPIRIPGPCQHAHRRGAENRDESGESDANERASRHLSCRWPESLGRDHGEPSCRVQRVKCKQFWIQQHERHQFTRSARTTAVTTNAASSAAAAKITPTDYTPPSNVSTPSSSARTPPAYAPAFWSAVAPLPSTQPAPAIGLHQ